MKFMDYRTDLMLCVLTEAACAVSAVAAAACAGRPDVVAPLVLLVFFLFLGARAATEPAICEAIPTRTARPGGGAAAPTIRISNISSGSMKFDNDPAWRVDRAKNSSDPLDSNSGA